MLTLKDRHDEHAPTAASSAKEASGADLMMGANKSSETSYTQ
jgi:hypothetical protein